MKRVSASNPMMRPLTEMVYGLINKAKRASFEDGGYPPGNLLPGPRMFQLPINQGTRKVRKDVQGFEVPI
ncbi:MAG: hypothetical protein U5S82_03070 [Gammaproteobacteria bacterium]|nr:hypothetical protein [Gammaproteobacteria bacterium]